MIVHANWNALKNNQRQRAEYERYELLEVIQRLRDVRKTGRPVDVLAVVDDALEQLDRPVYRPCNNRRANQAICGTFLKSGG